MITAAEHRGLLKMNSSPWYSFNDQMHDIFGGKVYRLALSTGATCPNRDGTLSSGGCIFCSRGGSGEFAACAEDSISAQIEAAKAKVAAKTGKNSCFAGYMAYFQPFTNTYGDTDFLAALFEEAVSFPEIVSLCIATRPDCLKEEMIERLARINEDKPVFVELGLQTIHEDTARYINRCFCLDVFEDAFARLKARGIRVVVHVMAGLPGEDAQKTEETVKYLSELEYNGARIDGIKTALLYVLENTPLADLLPDEIKIKEGGGSPCGYIELKDKVPLFQYTLYEYAALIKELVRMLPDGIAVHRVSGDPPKKDLILPKWPADKKRVLNTIRKEFQGKN